MSGWDQVHRRNYESAVLNWTGWWKLADDLLHSARLLRPRARAAWRSLEKHRQNRDAWKLDHYTGPFLMLTAYAVENFLKGALVLRDREKIRSDLDFVQHGKLPKLLKGHELVALAAKLNLKLDQRAKEALLRLERCAVWAGRYPVALNYQQANNAKSYNGTVFNVGYRAAGDFDYMEQLVRDIRVQLDIKDLPSEFRARRLRKKRAQRRCSRKKRNR